MKKVLIIGITGMIGSQFKKRFLELGYDVYGIARNSSASRLHDARDSKIFRVDITDFRALGAVIEKIKPDVVMHFAAQAFNMDSWNSPMYTINTNIVGTWNILENCRIHCPDAKIMVAGSSTVYGDADPSEMPLKEERFLRPLSPYGVTKVATENFGYQYFLNYKLKVYLPRLFIHVGTGHPPATAIQNFARQLALMSEGKEKPIMHVGKLDTKRDFIDVRDGVDAMMLILDKGIPGEPYNICTGEALEISEILEKLIKISGLKVEIVSDITLDRPSDERILLGDNSKIKKLGWKRKYSIDETLKHVYDDWKARVA